MRYGLLALAMGFVPWSAGSEMRKARIISGFRRILPIKYGSAGEIHAVRGDWGAGDRICNVSQFPSLFTGMVPDVYSRSDEELFASHNPETGRLLDDPVG